MVLAVELGLHVGLEEDGLESLVAHVDGIASLGIGEIGRGEGPGGVRRSGDLVGLLLLDLLSDLLFNLSGQLSFFLIELSLEIGDHLVFGILSELFGLQ